MGDLQEEQLIVMKPGYCLGDQVLEFSKREEAGLKISFRSAQLETIQALVRAGAGLSLIPERSVDKNRKKCTPIPIIGIATDRAANRRHLAQATDAKSDSKRILSLNP